MSFRQACGLSWMAAMGVWQVENLPVMMLLAEREFLIASPLTAISLFWTFGLGYLIGWKNFRDL